MKSRQNLISIVLTIAFVATALFLESALDSIEDSAKITFDMRSSILGQLGLALFFGLLVVIFFQVTVVHMKPARWVYAAQLAVGILALLPMLFSYVFRVNLLSGIPVFIRWPMISNPPSSYFGIATMIVLWVGASGLLRPRRLEQSK